MFIVVKDTSLKDALLRIDHIDKVRHQGRCEYGDYCRIYFVDGSFMHTIYSIESINKLINQVMNRKNS